MLKEHLESSGKLGKYIFIEDVCANANSMGRGKGQYIVKAIMEYRNSEGMTMGHVVVPTVDYEKACTVSDNFNMKIHK